MKDYKYKKQKYQSKLPADNVRLPTEKELFMGMAEAMLLAKVVEINEKDKKNKEGNNV
jgi:hypothetical protein